MPFQKDSELKFRFTYDFSEQGGAVSAIDLTPQLHSLEAGLIVKSMYIEVETALDSAGSPTVTIGDGDDADGYFADFYSLAGSNNAVINSSEVAGALIWDDTNDHQIYHRIGANAGMQMTVGTAALTAGKFTLIVECVKA